MEAMKTLDDIRYHSAKARKAAAAYEQSISRRDALIAEAWADGIRRQLIAEAAGISAQRVSQMAATPRQRGRPRGQSD